MRRLKHLKTAVFLAVCLTLLPGTVTRAGAADEITFMNMLKLMDLPQCLLLSYRCIPFGCGGDLLCHNIPAGFVETTAAPFTSVIPFVGAALQSAMQGTGLGSGGAGQAGNTNLHFFEAHVFNFPSRTFIRTALPFLKMCPYGPLPFEINYLSEVDAIGWRNGIQDFISLQFLLGMLAQISQICSVTSVGENIGDVIGVPIEIPGFGIFQDICMGTWGVTYPRTGFSNSQSEVVASASAAYRATRVVAFPFLRVVFIPKLFSAVPRMQLGYPFYGKPLNCFAKGTSPVAWDNLTTKLPRGRGYVWVIWEKKCCCLPPTGCLGVPPF